MSGSVNSVKTPMSLWGWRVIYAFLLTVGFFSISVPVFGEEPAKVSYGKQVEPLWRAYCIGCHNSDEPKGGLNLTSFADLQKGGDSGEKLVAAGKSNESHLWKLLSGTEEPKMPPAKSKQPTTEELKLIELWIDQGGIGPDNGEKTSQKSLDLPMVVVKHQQPAAVVSVAYSGDGGRLYAARDRTLEVYDTATGDRVGTWKGDEYPLNRVAVSRDGTRIAAAGGAPGVAGKVFLFGNDGTLLRTVEGHEDSIYGLDFSPDGTQLLTGSYDKLLKIWDVATGAELRTLKHHTGGVFDCRFSPEGLYVASASVDQTIKIWETATGNRLHTLTEGTKGMNALAWKPDGSELAAGGADKMIRTWSWQNGQAKLRQSTFAHDGSVLALCYHPTESKLYSSGEDRQIKCWDSDALTESLVFEAAHDWGQALAISPSSDMLTAAIHDGSVTGYSPTTGKVLRAFSAPVQQVAAVAAEGSGTGVVTANAEAAKPLEDQKAAEEPKPNPPSPQLNGISPEHTVRGQKVTVTLSGRNIWNADRIWVSPNYSHQLLPGDEKLPNERKCEIEIPADAGQGLCSIRLHTPLGTTEIRRFYIGPFAEIAEKEDHLAAPAAEGVNELQNSWVGRIETPGDVDFWPFSAQAGEEVVFEVQGKSFGSNLDPKLAILSPEGKILAESKRMLSGRPVWIGFKAETAGRYVLKVEDRNFSGSGGHHYLIHAGNFPYVTESFPLGISKDDPNARIQVWGFNLAGITEYAPKSRAPGHRGERIEVGDRKTFNEIEFDVSEGAELTEVPSGNPVMIPVTGGVSGRIEAPGESDTYAFEGKQGERLTLEVVARRHYLSPLDSQLEILNERGEPLARHTVRPVAETWTVLRDHDSRGGGIRLQNWNEFRENEYLMIGNEIVKILAFPAGPDSDVKFYTSGGLRKGMFGTTPSGHALNSPVYKVEIHPPAINFPPNGMPVRQLYWRNDDGGSGYQSDSQILFDVPQDGRYLVRVRDVRGGGGPDYRYRLAIRPRREDFSVSMNPDTPNVPLGGTLPVTLSIDRREDFSGGVSIELSGLPSGITATPVRIEPNGVDAVFTLTSDGSQPNLPAEDWSKLKVTARGEIDGQEVVRNVGFGFGESVVTLTSPPTLTTAVSTDALTLSAGEVGSVEATIERRHGFKGRVPLEVLNLPQGLSLLDVGLNGILITESQTSRSFSIRCEDYVPPGEYLIYAAGRVESLGERHPSIPIRVTVTSSPQVATDSTNRESAKAPVSQ